MPPRTPVENDETISDAARLSGTEEFEVRGATLTIDAPIGADVVSQIFWLHEAPEPGRIKFTCNARSAVRPEWFGGAPDAPDSTVALQNALDSAGGRLVFLADGDWNISSVSVPAHSHLAGQAPREGLLTDRSINTLPGARIVATSPPAERLLVVEGASEMDVRIESVHLHGKFPVACARAGEKIDLVHIGIGLTSRVFDQRVPESVVVSGCAFSGLSSGVSGSWLQDMQVLGCVFFDLGRGVELAQYTRRCSVAGCHFNKTIASAIEVIGREHRIEDNVIFRAGNDPIRCSRSFGGIEVSDILISGNYIDQAGMDVGEISGIELDNGVTNCVIRNNRVLNTKTAAIQAENGCQDILIEGNLVRTSAGAGIIIGGTAHWQRVVPELVQGDDNGERLYSGLRSRDIRVVANWVVDCGHGILFQNADAQQYVENIELRANICADNRQNGIQVPDKALVRGLTVAGNACVRNKGHGIAIDAYDVGLYQNLCRGNDKRSIQVTNARGVRIVECACVDNDEPGILVSGGDDFLVASRLRTLSGLASPERSVSSRTTSAACRESTARVSSRVMAHRR